MRLPRWALVVVLLLAALVLLFPMRVALAMFVPDGSAFAVREVRGTIWRATLSEVQFAGAALGDVEASLAPLLLLLGRARIDVDSAQGLVGHVTLSRRTSRIVAERALIENVTLPGDLRALVRLTGFEARFADGRCIEAAGLASVMLDPATPAGSAAPPADVRIRCDAGAVFVALPIAGGGVRIGSDGSIRPAQ